MANYPTAARPTGLVEASPSGVQPAGSQKQEYGSIDRKVGVSGSGADARHGSPDFDSSSRSAFVAPDGQLSEARLADAHHSQVSPDGSIPAVVVKGWGDVLEVLQHRIHVGEFPKVILRRRESAPSEGGVATTLDPRIEAFLRHASSYSESQLMNALSSLSRHLSIANSLERTPDPVRFIRTFDLRKIPEVDASRILTVELASLAQRALERGMTAKVVVNHGEQHVEAEAALRAVLIQNPALRSCLKVVAMDGTPDVVRQRLRNTNDQIDLRGLTTEEIRQLLTSTQFVEILERAHKDRKLIEIVAVTKSEQRIATIFLYRGVLLERPELTPAVRLLSPNRFGVGFSSMGMGPRPDPTRPVSIPTPVMENAGPSKPAPLRHPKPSATTGRKDFPNSAPPEDTRPSGDFNDTRDVTRNVTRNVTGASANGSNPLPAASSSSTAISGTGISGPGVSGVPASGPATFADLSLGRRYRNTP